MAAGYPRLNPNGYIIFQFAAAPLISIIESDKIFERAAGSDCFAADDTTVLHQPGRRLLLRGGPSTGQKD
jgi:hypothetical protein